MVKVGLFPPRRQGTHVEVVVVVVERWREWVFPKKAEEQDAERPQTPSIASGSTACSRV